MELYSLIIEMLEQGRPVAMARIINLKGSAPRSTGVSCILTDEGRLYGTIGGGSLEYQVQQKTIEIIKSKKSVLFEFTMGGEDVSDSQMLCGGEATIYIEPLTPDNSETLEVYRRLSRIRRNGQTGSLITRIATGTDAAVIGQRRLICKNGEEYGELEIPGQLVGTPGSGVARLRRENDSGSRVFFIEPFGLPDKVIIFGGGHVSTCLAPLLKPLGFSTTVVDDRREFANANRFPEADHIYAVSFNQVFDLFQTDSSTYIVIVTRGHKHDKEVLAESLRRPTAYIGMIGSRKKREAIYRALLEEGFTSSQLVAVYSPIGIDILSETPEEIAVSITAELIRVRAEKRSEANS